MFFNENVMIIHVLQLGKESVGDFLGAVWSN